MQIPPVASGLTGTSQAIQRNLARFEADAQQATAEAEALASDQPSDGTGLTQALVGMRTDAITNSILFGVFQRQAEQERALTDLVKPR